MKLIKTGGLLLLSMSLVAGCSQDHPTHGVNTAKSTDSFDTKPEPALTARTHFAAGQVAESQGDVVRAANQYEQAVKLDPKFAAPLLRLGLIYAGAKQYDASILAWTKYVTATNGSAAAYSDLGYCLAMANRLPEAEKAYKTGVAREPLNEPCRVNYGLFLARQGRLDEATMQLTAVLTEAEAHYNLASVFESQGKKDAAKAQYRLALQCDPKLQDAKVRLAGIE